jgi:2',3'-cyclic-nucleotide 2'-phosphodiesterase (5'-nucleotidase family)
VARPRADHAARRHDVQRARAGHELAHRARHAHVLLAAAALALAACRGRAPASAPAPAPTAAAPADAGAPRDRIVSLVYTSNVGGEVARCGCAVEPLGGLARRAAEVARIRGQVDGVLSVDAGDLFLPPAEGSGRGRPPAPRDLERRARLLATAYARLGVAAFSPGERDLAVGVPLLRRVLADAGVPVVSSNLVDESGALLFPADRLVEIAGVKIGVFGVTAAAVLAPGVVARDPTAAARAEAASLRARGARVVVALVHVGALPAARRVLVAAPGIDWAVLGHSGRNLETPELVPTPDGGGARALEALSLGRNLGRLDLHVATADGAGPYADGAARERTAAIRADHERQIADYEEGLGDLEPSARAEADKRLASLRAALARETRDLAGMPVSLAGNWFENRIIPMDASLPDDPAMAALVGELERAPLTRGPAARDLSPRRGER